MSTVCRNSSHAFLTLLLFMMAACARSPAREGVTAIQAHMYAHFDRAGEVHDALVRGDMEVARSAAEWLASHPETRALPEGSAPFGAEMVGLARRVQNAESIETAAAAAAQMGRSCGDCHRRYEVSPRFLVGTAAPSGDGPKAQMARHIWAAERMWEGLLGPEDFAWNSGAASLKEGWLSPGEVVADPEDGQRVKDLVRQVYMLGTRAEAAETPEARAEIYGEFLNTCIGCHSLTGAIIR